MRCVMKRCLNAALLIFCLPLWVFSQGNNNFTAEELFYQADEFYNLDDEPGEAAYIYKQVLDREPDNANVEFLIGQCYVDILGQEQEAIPYLREATKNTTLKYKDRKYTEKQAPYHSWYLLADAYRKTNQLDSAIAALDQFRSLKNFEKHYNLRITEDFSTQVERAKIIRDAELNLRALYFNEPINTTSNDFSGVISANGKMMVWANSRAFQDVVMMSTREGTQWSVPQIITPQIATEDVYPTGLSADGTTLLLVKDDGRRNTDLWYSRFDGLIWSPAQPLFGKINSGANESHGSFSPDGDRIYLSSDRRGGFGGFDIWYSDRQGDGQWGEPVNAGEIVNTEEDETSAYMAPDGSRFIFASKGHFNMGGYDLFRCEISPDGTWSQPTNIGYPINTTGDNTMYVPLNDGLSGLYTRYTNDAIGQQDLWYVEILSDRDFVSGGLTLAIDSPGLSHKDFAIIVVNEDTGEEIEILYDADSDSFKALGGEDRHYRVVSYKQQ